MPKDKSSHLSKHSRLHKAPSLSATSGKRPAATVQNMQSRIEQALQIDNDFHPCFDWNFPPPLNYRPAELTAEQFFQYESVEEDRISLYLHIPFCASVCKFCYFTVQGKAAPDAIADYLSYLIREIHLYGPVAQGKIIESIYIGGGTPSLLNASQLTQLFGALQQQFLFTKDIEITLESAPGSLDHSKLQCLKSLGVNRLSYGIQSLDQALLHGLNRHYVISDALLEIADAVDVIGNVNVDTMYGFEGEDDQTLTQTLSTLIDLKVASISLYALDPKRWEQHSLNEGPQNDAHHQDKLKRFAAASELLQDRGYFPVLQNIFVHPKRGSYRHQTRRWDNLPLLAMGVSSAGYTPRMQYQNIYQIKDYKAAIDAGHFPVESIQTLTANLECAREIVSRLRFDKVDIAAVQRKYGLDVKLVYAELIDALVNLGLLEETKTHLKLTPKAVAHNNIIPMFFAPDDFVQQLWGLPENYRETYPLPKTLLAVGNTQSAPFD